MSGHATGDYIWHARYGLGTVRNDDGVRVWVTFTDPTVGTVGLRPADRQEWPRRIGAVK